MIVCLNSVKALLVSAIRNDPDCPRFLALEALVFLARIYFLDLAVFDLYNFSMLALFHLDPLLGFHNHLALDFLLHLLLRLFLEWR